jgi:tRNA-dihydrouridine synthase
MAIACEEAGAKAITVHGRTTMQAYSGKADLDAIKRVKECVKIPVIGNGDVTGPISAKRMLEYTGCDAIMIGRGAVGNPYLFAEIKAALEGGTFAPPSLDEKKAMALRQLALAIEDKGERVAVPEARRQIAVYFKGFRGSAALRARINSALTYGEVESALSELEDEKI